MKNAHGIVNQINVKSAFEKKAQVVIEQTDDLKKRLKAKKEELELKLEENQDYVDLKEQAAEITKKKKVIKEKLLQKESVSVIADDVKDLNGQLKGTQLTLSMFLFEYHNDTKKEQITDLAGKVRKIDRVAKLKR